MRLPTVCAAEIRNYLNIFLLVLQRHPHESDDKEDCSICADCVHLRTLMAATLRSAPPH